MTQRSKGLPINRGTLLYISGPITPTTQYPNKVENIARMREVGQRWFKRGYSVFVPGSNNSGWDGVTYDEYVSMDIAVLAKCQGIVMMEGWEWSRGADKEYHRSNILGITIFFDKEFSKYNGKEV